MLNPTNIKLPVLLSVFFYCLCYSSNLYSQIIQLGAGTGESWEQNSSPVNIYYRRTVCQFVYTAEELTEAYASSVNPITKLGFYIVESPIYDIPGYNIKMKNVPLNDVSNDLGAIDWVTVKNPFLYTPNSGGFDMIALDTPFLWDGISSIAIEICWQQVQPTWNASGKVRIYGSNNGYRYSWTDSPGSSCGSLTNTVTSNKPQIQFIFNPGTETEWTGSLNSDWFDENNWTAGIPNLKMDAIIPNGTPNYPVLNGSGAKTKNLTIDSNASFEINGTDSLEIYGNWNNNGLFIKNKSTIIFKGFGGSPNTMEGSPNQDFHSLEIRSEQGLTLLNGSYLVSGLLRLRGGMFTSNDLITLTSDQNQTGNLTRIQNFCNYNLNMLDSYGDGWNGGYIKLRVDGEIVDYYNAEGIGLSRSLPLPDGSEFSLEYNPGSYENENSYDLIDNNGDLIFSAGPSPSAGLIFSGIATCPFENTFNGNLTLERSIVVNNDEWREISTGIKSQTLSNIQNSGILMTNFQGSNFPNFGWTSVYYYNESEADGIKENGWTEPSSILDSINPSTGYRMYIGNGNYKISVNGEPYTGDYEFNLGYQNLLNSEIIADEDEKGWNLIGNPYPCSISWDGIETGDKVNIDNAIWIWSGEAGNYGIYQGGSKSGTNSVRNNIASSQAFWVHANAAGATLKITEKSKSETSGVFVKNEDIATNFRVKLSGGNNSFYDEISLSKNSMFSNLFDQYDGEKLFSSLNTAPQLYIITKEHSLSIATFNDFVSKNVNLGIYIPADGMYKLDFKDLKSVPDIKCCKLEDKQSGIFHDILSNKIVEFYSTEGWVNERFILHLSDSDYNNNGCFISNDNAVNLNDSEELNFQLYPNPTNGRSVTIEGNAIIENISIVDILGNTTGNFICNGQKTILNLDSYSAGIYLVKLNSNGYEKVFRLHITN